MMKRRNDPSKLRRPLKRTKIDNFYGGSFMYLKLMLLWGLVLLADHFVEFRFEYLWPLWLFLRSVYDSFKYQGLAFSVFFVCIAITSDLVCFLFIPIHWVFFAASTYVWVQYVWHTEKGICLPTVFLWLLFVYVEASIRLKDFRVQVDLRPDLSFHLDLCRPFASHCIGYPVVSLGFGFKSYVGFRMRLRRQREVRKENELYYEFLKLALPSGSIRDDAFSHRQKLQNLDERLAISHDVSSNALSLNAYNTTVSSTTVNSPFSSPISSSCSVYQQPSYQGDKKYSYLSSSGTTVGNNNIATAAVNSLIMGEQQNKGSKLLANGNASSFLSMSSSSASNLMVNDNLNDFCEFEDSVTSSKGAKVISGNNSLVSVASSTSNGGGGGGGFTKKSKSDTSKASNKEDAVSTKLEIDVKKLKADLQISKNKEHDLRHQIISHMSNERHLKSEISSLQVEKCVLESRIASLVASRATEKVSLTQLEKRLNDERKLKADLAAKLDVERRSKKDALSAERTALQIEKSEISRIEIELRNVCSELAKYKERCLSMESETAALRKFRDDSKESQDVLVNAVTTLKVNNAALEKSLSAETKLKMDLFSAFGDTKRQLTITRKSIVEKDRLIEELKQKIAEVLAVMPPPATSTSSPFMSLDVSPSSADLGMAATNPSLAVGNKISSPGGSRIFNSVGFHNGNTNGNIH